MKRNYSALLTLLFVTSAAFAQKPQTADVVEQNLRKHIEYLASDQLEGRRAGEPGATLAGNYVAEAFRRAGLKPGVPNGKGKSGFLQNFSYTPVRDPHSAPTEPTAVTGAQGKNAFNVIGILPGRDPILKNEAIVIGAHYDHLGHGGSGSLAANSTEIHHGADDNASGTSAVIELARIFARERFKNKRTIIFIAFSGEEDGVFGSKFYVNDPVFPPEKTIAMINLDMVGRLKDNKLTIGGIGTASEWKQLVDSKNTVGLHIPQHVYAQRFSLQLNEDGFGPSDHSSFYGKKIPVLFFFTGTHEDYHKPSDTFEKINYEGLSRVTHYVSSIIRTIDQNPTRPIYTVAKSSGSMGRTGFNVSLGTIPNYADSTDGLLLDGVRDNSPAAKAGLKAGDKVIKLAGKDVKNVYDYTAALGEMKPDVEYEIVVKRGGETLTLKIVPAPAARR